MGSMAWSTPRACARAFCDVACGFAKPPRTRADEPILAVVSATPNTLFTITSSKVMNSAQCQRMIALDSSKGKGVQLSHQNLQLIAFYGPLHITREPTVSAYWIKPELLRGQMSWLLRAWPCGSQPYEPWFLGKTSSYLLVPSRQVHWRQPCIAVDLHQLNALEQHQGIPCKVGLGSGRGRCDQSQRPGLG